MKVYCVYLTVEETDVLMGVFANEKKAKEHVDWKNKHTVGGWCVVEMKVIE